MSDKLTDLEHDSLASKPKKAQNKMINKPSRSVLVNVHTKKPPRQWLHPDNPAIWTGEI